MGVRGDAIELSISSELAANQTFFVLLISISDTYLLQVDAPHALRMLKSLWLDNLVLDHLVAEEFPHLDESFVFCGLLSLCGLRVQLGNERIGLVFKLRL